MKLLVTFIAGVLVGVASLLAYQSAHPSIQDRIAQQDALERDRELFKIQMNYWSGEGSASLRLDGARVFIGPTKISWTPDDVATRACVAVYHSDAILVPPPDFVVDVFSQSREKVASKVCVPPWESEQSEKE